MVYTEPMTLHLIEMTLMCMHQVKELKLQVMGVGALEAILVYKVGGINITPEIVGTSS